MFPQPYREDFGEEVEHKPKRGKGSSSVPSLHLWNILAGFHLWTIELQEAEGLAQEQERMPIGSPQSEHEGNSCSSMNGFQEHALSCFIPWARKSFYPIFQRFYPQGSHNLRLLE